MLAGAAFATQVDTLDGLPDDLTDMSLMALMNIADLSVSKRPRKPWQSAVALFVITHGDLRRREARAGRQQYSIGGNLFDKRHTEYLPDFNHTQLTEVERSIYSRVTGSF